MISLPDYFEREATKLQEEMDMPNSWLPYAIVANRLLLHCQMEMSQEQVKEVVETYKQLHHKLDEDRERCADCGRDIDRCWECDAKTGDHLCVDCLSCRKDMDYDKACDK